MRRKLLAPARFGLLGLVALCLPASGSAQQRRGDPTVGESPVAARINAHFARLPTFQPACTELEPHYIGGMAQNIPTQSTAELRQKQQDLTRSFGAFRDQRVEVRQRRQTAAQAVEDLMFESLAVYRALDVGAAEYTWAVGRQRAADFELMSAVSALTEAEDSLRAMAGRYFDLYVEAFRYVEEAQRQPVLQWFRTRAECLLEHRRETYEEIHRNRNAYILKAIEAAGADTLRERSATLPPLDPDSVPLGLDFLDSVDEGLDQAARIWAYAWLEPESTLNASVYRRLLAAEEKAVVNGPLHTSLESAIRSDPRIGPMDMPPGGESRRDLRLRVSQLRARQAALALHQKDVLLEAGYTKRLDIAAGLSEAGSQLAKDVRRAGSLDPGLGWIAAAGIAKRFLGTTLDVMVTTPLRDLVVAGLRETTGADWKTSADANLEAFLAARQALTRRIRLLERLANGHSYEQGLALADWIAGGGRGNPPSSIATVAPSTFRELLQDHDFVQTTGGGLPWILAALAEDPAFRTDLLLTGARFAMTGRTRAGFSRISLDRGITQSDPDAPVDERAVLALFHDTTTVADSLTVSAALSANMDRVLMSLPVVREAAAVRDAIQLVTSLPDMVKNSVRYVLGDAIAQEAYLQDLLRNEEWADQVIRGLVETDFDFGRLARERPAMYAIHLDLLTGAPEWIQAVGRIRAGEWERYKLDIHARGRASIGGRLPQDVTRTLATAQSAEEIERTDLAARGGRAQVEFDILTFEFGAAAAQLKALEAVENARLKARGSTGRVDMSTAVELAEGMALATELATVYKGLYLDAVKEVAFSMVSAGLADGLLGSTLGKELTEESFDMAEKLGSAFNPWMGKFSAGGVWSTLSGGLADGMKTVAAQTLNQNQEALLGGQMFSEQDIQAGLDALWDVTGDLRQRGMRELTARAAEGAVGIWAGTREYEVLMQEATQARDVLAEDFDAPAEDALRRMEDAVSRGDEDARLRAELDLGRLSTDPNLMGARFRYQLALQDLEDAGERRRVIQKQLYDLMTAVGFGELVKSRALDAAAADPGGVPRSAAALHGVVELRSRLALGVHTLDDLRSLVDDPGEGPDLRGRLLRPEMDIDVLRKALALSKQRAATPEEADEVDRIAVAMDDARIGRINGLLATFLEQHPEYAGQVEAVIQGGAAKGNPEYRGLFGDIDFTVFLREGATVDDAALKDAMLAFFRENGHPLAESAERPSSMDSEVFVQPWELFDPALKAQVDVIKDLQEKSNDPTRFYSEAGARWFRNNVFFSGSILWPGGRTDRGQWFEIQPHEAHGLALDMARYLGFLTDPHYSDEGLAELRRSDPAEYEKVLTKALDKSKYLLRLLDAYVISHDEGPEGSTGNDRYHDRQERVGRTGDEASYHVQIANDVAGLLEDQSAGRTTTVLNQPGDGEMVRQMAQMKLRGENPSPWSVLPGGEGPDGHPSAAALDQAENIVRRMRDLTPAILAHTASKWQEGQEAALASNDPGAANRVLSEVGRVASGLRNVMDLDDYGASALMIPPDPRIEDPDDRRREHERAIRTLMERTSDRRETLSADMAEVRRTVDPASDPSDEQARALVDDALDAREQAISRVRGEVALEERDQLAPWFDYLNTMIRRALVAGGTP